MKNNLRQIREARGLTQEQLAARFDKDRGHISRYESGKVSMSDVWIDMLCKELSCTPNELLGYSSDAGAIEKIEIWGDVPGGVPCEPMHVPSEEREYIYSNLPSPNKNSRYFALYVTGNSMNNRAPDGSVIIVDTWQTNPKELNGKPIIAHANGECTFKILQTDPVILRPDSTESYHKAIIPQGEWQIIGRVVSAIKRME